MEHTMDKSSHFFKKHRQKGGGSFCPCGQSSLTRAVMATMCFLLAICQANGDEYLVAAPFTVFPALEDGISAESAALSTLLLFNEAKIPNKLKLLQSSEEMEKKLEFYVKDSIDFYQLPPNAFNDIFALALPRHFSLLAGTIGKKWPPDDESSSCDNHVLLIQTALEKARKEVGKPREACARILKDSFLLEDVRELVFSPIRAKTLLQMHHPFLVRNADEAFICVLANNSGGKMEWFGYKAETITVKFEFNPKTLKLESPLERISTDGCMMLYFPDYTLNVNAIEIFIRNLLHEKNYDHSYIERE